MNRIGLQCIMFSDWLNMLHELFIVKVFLRNKNYNNPYLAFLIGVPDKDQLNYT